MCNSHTERSNNLLLEPHLEKLFLYNLCLATNQRLAIMSRSNTSLCNKCDENQDHTALHMFYQCQSIRPLFMWLLRILYYVCSFKSGSNIRFLYFDTIYDNSHQKTICNIFLYIYIFN